MKKYEEDIATYSIASQLAMKQRRKLKRNTEILV